MSRVVPLLASAAILCAISSAQAQPLPGYARPPAPEYPLALRENGIEGNVGVAVLISRDGKALCVWIAQSSGHRAMDNAAATAVRNARWLALPDEMEVIIPIRFRMASYNGLPSTVDLFPVMHPRVRQPNEAPWPKPKDCSRRT